jgi:hypothetical protein
MFGKETGWESVDIIYLAQEQWRAIMKLVMKVGFHKIVHYVFM